MNPILFNIMELLASLLGGIQKGEDTGANGTLGYYFTWNPSNQFDAVLMRPGPNASLFFRNEQPLNEEEGGNNGGLYENLADIDIEVQYLYDAAPENPQWAAQRDILKCQEDLKRLIDHKRDALGAVGCFDIYRPKDRQQEVKYSTDATNPAKLIMPWRIQYSQSRQEPELVG